MAQCVEILDPAIIVAAAIIFASLLILGVGIFLFARGHVPDSDSLSVITSVGKLIVAILIVTGSGVILVISPSSTALTIISSTLGMVVGFYFRDTQIDRAQQTNKQVNTEQNIREGK